MINDANYLEEALLKMKSVPPNPDGTIGFTVTPGMPEWQAWQAYFLGKRMDNRASFMRVRAEKGYMAPCRSPQDFDPEGIRQAREEYAVRLHNGEFGSGEVSRHAREIPAAERSELAEAVKGAVKHFGTERRRADDVRFTVPPKPVEPRPLTETEAASMKRLMGITEQKDAAE